MAITDMEQLINELQTPGLIGLRNPQGEIEMINKQILNNAPILLLIEELHKGNIFTCQN